MAEKKEEPKPFFTTEKVKLFAPKNAKYHSHLQQVEIQARQKEKFLKLGYSETEEDAQEAEAHPSISTVPPVAATAPAPKKANGKKAGTEAENEGGGGEDK